MQCIVWSLRAARREPQTKAKVNCCMDGRSSRTVNRRSLLAGLAGLTAMGREPLWAQTLGPQTHTTTRPATVAAIQPVNPGAPVSHPIEVTARPITYFERGNSTRTRFGRLEFRGGLVLGSAASEFGGWSGLVLDDAGRRMLMISDVGSWMTAELTYDGTRPKGITDAVLGPIVGIGGKPLDRKRDLDAEAVVLLDGTLTRGTVLIAFERVHRIGRFPIGERGLGAPTSYLKLPAEARRMKLNAGFEACGVIRGGPLMGSVIAFAEELHDAQRNHTGWIWPGSTIGEPQRLGLVNMADFAITDVKSLADGSLIVLERKFRWTEGVQMRLRLIKAATVKPGALLDGEVLLEANMGSDIDNMEGLALHTGARGETVLTLISDDNFNHFLQRNILLQFALVEK